MSDLHSPHDSLFRFMMSNREVAVEYFTLKTLLPVLHPEWHRFLPDFEYIYHSLGEVSDDTIALLRKGSLQELIFLLKYAHNALKLSDHLVELLKNPPFSFTSPEMRVIVKYLIHQSKMGRNKIIEIMETVPEEKKDDLMSIAEYLQEKVFERGVEKGIEQGIEKGIKKGIEQGVKQGVKRGMELGREEARNEKNHTAAVNMIRRGYSDTEVSEVLEVSLDYVRSIRKSLQQNP